MRPFGLGMRFRRFQPGDPVIFRKRKAGTCPGPRALNVKPAPRGDSYAYVVEKQWRVSAVDERGRLSLVTRRGKLHVKDATDHDLRRPSLWERWRLRHRFPALSRRSRDGTDSAEAASGLNEDSP